MNGPETGITAQPGPYNDTKGKFVNAATDQDAAVGDLIASLGIEGTVVLLALASLYLLRHRTIRSLVIRALRSLAGRLIRWVRVRMWASTHGCTMRLAHRLQSDRWKAMVEARGLSGLRRTKVRSTDEGVAVRVRLGKGLTVERLISALPSLETGLGVRRGSTWVEPLDRSDRAVLHIALRKVPAPVVAVPVVEGANEEETTLLGRLADWDQLAAERGLSGTAVVDPELTSAGIVATVRLDGKWTVKELRSAEDRVRALLGARTDLRIGIKAADRGGWAVITLRTRSAADGTDLSGWYPGAPWGVDTITGEPIMVPLGRRMLVAGTSGSGKSWSTRAILAEASETPDHRLVVLDMKRVEARNWEHRARTGVTPDEILAVTDELVEEMHERLKLVPRGQDVIKISADRPRITTFIDEGAELIAASVADKKEHGRIIENLRTLARMARAAEIIVVWATQKPTMSGEGHGIDSQIAGQITYRASLALSTSGESRTVFGDDSHERGWHAHDLPQPGVALLRSSPKAKPHPVDTRAFSPAHVIALPDRPIWSRQAERQVARPTLVLVKDAPEPQPELTAMSAEDAVRAVLGPDPLPVAEIVERTGRSQSQVYTVVKTLVAEGHAHKVGSKYVGVSA